MNKRLFFYIWTKISLFVARNRFFQTIPLSGSTSCFFFRFNFFLGIFGPRITNIHIKIHLNANWSAEIWNSLILIKWSFNFNNLWKTTLTKMTKILFSPTKKTLFFNFCQIKSIYSWFRICISHNCPLKVASKKITIRKLSTR